LRVTSRGLGDVYKRQGLRHAGVSSIVIGARTRNEMNDDLSYAAEVIPQEFWDALETLS
jgi:hypothetical protein